LQVLSEGRASSLAYFYRPKIEFQVSTLIIWLLKFIQNIVYRPSHRYSIKKIYFFLQVLLEGTISWLHLEAAQTGPLSLNTIHLISKLDPKYSIVCCYTRHAVKNQIHPLIEMCVGLYCMWEYFERSKLRELFKA
jgi:hypothetical protein